MAVHLHQLAALRDQGHDPGQRLHAVLQTYALIQHEHHGHELTALHQGEHMVHAKQHLHQFVASLLADASTSGHVRGDIAPGELAEYCQHALGAFS